VITKVIGSRAWSSLALGQTEIHFWYGVGLKTGQEFFVWGTYGVIYYKFVLMIHFSNPSLVGKFNTPDET